ncbi:hypothetical protein [Streptomyces sp. NRRL F-5727]|uniref:hypothetical protein n=1 Tax=Streptomyces sp. NRRL F-5727 TaxID=1463871 RepID=UPI0004C848F7|nr:hypothetical protein [Streptomyces sp. NRRL F-5727]
MTQNGQGPEQGGAQAWGGAWGPAGAQAQPGGQPLPPAQPLPPEAPPAGDLQATQYIAPVPPQPQGAPMPPAGPPAGYGYPPPVAAHGADMQATQHIAPVPGGVPPVGPPAGYGYPPPAAAPVADLQATQHIAPVPPQAGPGGGAQTQFLGTGRLPQPPAPAGASDATQYMAPVPGGPAPGGPVPGGPVPGGPAASQPPAEFDSLFRDSAPARPAPPAYQQQAPAPYQQHPPQHHQPPQQQQYGYQGGGGYQAPGGHQDAYYYDDEPEPPRRKSPVALIAAVVVGCAIVGLGVGALLSGGDDEKEPTAGTSVAPSSQAPATGDGASQAPEKKDDPAEPQARELDKLLATSNDSRDTVISSVESIKQCKNLDKAAADLRGAAEQRRGLVTKLQTLEVDKLPDSQALTAALTRAWQASAAADDHYAGWADQMKAKNACKGGQAKTTNRLKAANDKSAEATKAKKEAAGLWNPTAGKYGLTKRSATQL